MSDKPVLAADAPWEKVAVMCPHVIWDAEAKRYRMWYSSGEQYEPDAIGHATSPDGLTWTKHAANPVFAADPCSPWEQHKVTACQVVRRGAWYLMFYIGFFDVHRAQIGIARSQDGIGGWERHPANPVISPGLHQWDHDACYKPYAIFDGKQWLLWYNGRRGNVEQIGLATHAGEDLGFDAAAKRASAAVLKAEDFRHYVDGFNQTDNELYQQHVPNAAAWGFLKDNIPLPDCPDKEIEQTYYFRWWTYGKHIQQTPDGFVITEFLPPVGWAGKHNTINCPVGHHIREGRWRHDPRYLDDDATFWLRKGGDERGKDYNHSTFCDLVITGLIGLRPRADQTVEVNPLVPEGRWDWFCLDHVAYHGRMLTIVYDRTGAKYGRGQGLRVLADGQEIAASDKLERVSGELARAKP